MQTRTCLIDEEPENDTVKRGEAPGQEHIGSMGGVRSQDPSVPRKGSLGAS